MASGFFCAPYPPNHSCYNNFNNFNSFNYNKNTKSNKIKKNKFRRMINFFKKRKNEKKIEKNN